MNLSGSKELKKISEVIPDNVNFNARQSIILDEQREYVYTHQSGQFSLTPFILKRFDLDMNFIDEFADPDLRVGLTNVTNAFNFSDDNKDSLVGFVNWVPNSSSFPRLTNITLDFDDFGSCTASFTDISSRISLSNTSQHIIVQARREDEMYAIYSSNSTTTVLVNVLFRIYDIDNGVSPIFTDSTVNPNIGTTVSHASHYFDQDTLVSYNIVYNINNEGVLLIYDFDNRTLISESANEIFANEYTKIVKKEGDYLWVANRTTDTSTVIDGIIIYDLDLNVIDTIAIPSGEVNGSTRFSKALKGDENEIIYTTTQDGGTDYFRKYVITQKDTTKYNISLDSNDEIQPLVNGELGWDAILFEENRSLTSNTAGELFVPYEHLGFGINYEQLIVGGIIQLGNIYQMSLEGATMSSLDLSNFRSSFRGTSYWFDNNDTIIFHAGVPEDEVPESGTGFILYFIKIILDKNDFSNSTIEYMCPVRSAITEGVYSGGSFNGVEYIFHWDKINNLLYTGQSGWSGNFFDMYMRIIDVDDTGTSLSNNQIPDTEGQNHKILYKDGDFNDYTAYFYNTLSSSLNKYDYIGMTSSVSENQLSDLEGYSQRHIHYINGNFAIARNVWPFTANFDKVSVGYFDFDLNLKIEYQSEPEVILYSSIPNIYLSQYTNRLYVEFDVTFNRGNYFRILTLKQK